MRGNAEGLENWQSTILESGNTQIKVTSTPSQHGFLFTRPFAGQTIGFILEWVGQKNGALYISGDTIYFRGIKEIAERFKVGIGIFHMGRASFPLTGPLRFTMDGNDGVRTAAKLNPHTIIPVHYEGWRHFSEGKRHIEKIFESTGMNERVKWLPLGVPTS